MLRRTSPDPMRRTQVRRSGGGFAYGASEEALTDDLRTALHNAELARERSRTFEKALARAERARDEAAQRGRAAEAEATAARRALSELRDARAGDQQRVSQAETNARKRQAALRRDLDEARRERSEIIALALQEQRAAQQLAAELDAAAREREAALRSELDASRREMTELRDQLASALASVDAEASLRAMHRAELEAALESTEARGAEESKRLSDELTQLHATCASLQLSMQDQQASMSSDQLEIAQCLDQAVWHATLDLSPNMVAQAAPGADPETRCSSIAHLSLAAAAARAAGALDALGASLHHSRSCLAVGMRALGSELSELERQCARGERASEHALAQARVASDGWRQRYEASACTVALISEGRAAEAMARASDRFHAHLACRSALENSAAPARARDGAHGTREAGGEMARLERQLIRAEREQLESARALILRFHGEPTSPLRAVSHPASAVATSSYRHAPTRGSWPGDAALAYSSPPDHPAASPPSAPVRISPVSTLHAQCDAASTAPVQPGLLVPTLPPSVSEVPASPVPRVDEPALPPSEHSGSSQHGGKAAGDASSANAALIRALTATACDRR